MPETHYSVEHLSKKDVSCFFVKAQEQFPYLFLNINPYAYSQKLADYANFIVCRCSGQMAGILAFYMNNGLFAYVTFICTLKDFQGLSIFSGMLYKLECLSREKGYRKIRLEVACSNITAQQIYLHKGFSVVEKGDNTIFMEKKLANQEI